MLLTFRPGFRYKKQSKLAHVKDASYLTAAGGASAVPAGKGSSLLLSGGSGISLPALGPACEVLAASGAGAGGGNPPPLVLVS
jgi:hypothetical protein